MRKLFLTTVSMMLMSSAFAGPMTGGCTGTFRGKKITFRGSLKEMMSFNSGSGALYYDNRLIARFAGDDLSVNLLFTSFKMVNNHGERIEGKATSLTQMKANITRISVPSYGLNIVNLPVSCWRN